MALGSTDRVIYQQSVAQTVKFLPAMRETQVWSLGWEDPWRRKWQPTLVSLPGESYGLRSLVGYSPWGQIMLFKMDWVSEWKAFCHVWLFGTSWTITIHRILQARILEWVAVAFSRVSSQSRDQTQVSHIAGDSLPSEPPGKPKMDWGKIKMSSRLLLSLFSY